MGRSLVLWSSKKQNSVALSTAEAKYISAGSCCAQVLWMKATLSDYGIKFKKVTLLYDNESAIKLINKSVHSTCKNKAHWCLPPFHKRSSTKRGHLHWECRHRRSTCRYIHQAIRWEKVLQALEWVEHIGFLKYVLMHPPHLYDMPLLRAIQGKSWLAWHTSLLRTCLAHLVTFLISLGPFKWFYFIRLIHENQMNLMFIWYHYCFYA